ncbi:MAG: PIN domain-containing protein [Oscillospiraceae bacterium]|nr:PIN domain-containing protein [Oscillospiraceae bacterium]
MILVDTSVIIDTLKKNETPKSSIYLAILSAGSPYCISVLTYHELLQGAKNEQEFEQLKEYFGSQSILQLPNDKDFFEQSASIYFALRRKGKTIRSTVDVMIAMQAIHGNHTLLHDDRDFDAIADEFSELKILTGTK